MKVVIPYIVFVFVPRVELPKVIEPVDVAYNEIASVVNLPVIVFASNVFVIVVLPFIVFVEIPALPIVIFPVDVSYNFIELPKTIGLIVSAVNIPELCVLPCNVMFWFVFPITTFVPNR